MVLNLSLSPELQERLHHEAERRGLSLDAVMIDLLDRHLPHGADQRRAAALAMLDQWVQEDEALSDEAAAENTALLHALDEHRSSHRKLFEDLEGDANCGSSGAA